MSVTRTVPSMSPLGKMIQLTISQREWHFLWAIQLNTVGIGLDETTGEWRSTCGLDDMTATAERLRKKGLINTFGGLNGFYYRILDRGKAFL